MTTTTSAADDSVGAAKVRKVYEIHQDRIAAAVDAFRKNGCATSTSADAQCNVAAIGSGVNVKAMALVIRQVREQTPITNSDTDAHADRSLEMLDAAGAAADSFGECVDGGVSDCSTELASIVPAVEAVNADVTAWLTTE